MEESQVFLSFFCLLACLSLSCLAFVYLALYILYVFLFVLFLSCFSLVFLSVVLPIWSRTPTLTLTLTLTLIVSAVMSPRKRSRMVSPLVCFVSFLSFMFVLPVCLSVCLSRLSVVSTSWLFVLSLYCVSLSLPCFCFPRLYLVSSLSSLVSYLFVFILLLLFTLSSLVLPCLVFSCLVLSCFVFVLFLYYLILLLSLS